MKDFSVFKQDCVQLSNFYLPGACFVCKCSFARNNIQAVSIQSTSFRFENEKCRFLFRS
jgi:hypothetical protein